MRDLTEGPVPRHLIGLAAPIAAGMLFQTLYHLVDLYFVVVIQIVSVTLNAVLSPILIVGWVTGRPMGVAGAGLASSISLAVGLLLLTIYFVRSVTYARVELSLSEQSLARPRLDVWRRILQVGLPPGGEFALLFVYMGVIYWVIRDFGAAVQAGFGVGSRVMQAIFLPPMAIAFATTPVAGQNFGAGLTDRVKETFRTALWLGGGLMLTLTLLCQVRPDWFIRIFTSEPEVIAVGGQFLRIISWNFVASGLIFTVPACFRRWATPCRPSRAVPPGCSPSSCRRCGYRASAASSCATSGICRSLQ